MADQIESLREQIDQLDLQLLDLLNQRAQVASRIGEVKKKAQSAVFHPARELQVIKHLELCNPGPLKEGAVASIWREIMSACRALEQTLQVAFLGPAGSYSEEAAISYFGSSTDFQPCPDIDAVFKAVENGNCRYGVVAIENSTEGAVTRALDLLQQTSLKIVGEVGLTIRHALLRKENNLQDIEVVYGHAQALAQCQQWLNKNLPHAKREAVASNSLGAQYAAKDCAAAAIASKRSANAYGLHMLMSNIQDLSHNRTRFVVLADECEQQPFPGDSEACTSIVVSVPNRPGALYNLLAPLNRHGVSLSRLESRPARSGQWEYFFYIDIQGHIQEIAVIKALEEVKQICTFFKLLGCYPIAQESVSCSSV